MKKLFITPKGSIISIICIVIAIAAISTILIKSTPISKTEAQSISMRDTGLSEAHTQATPAGSATSNTNSTYIGIDRAKEIALNHANLNEADVQFAKAKLENDHGKEEYEIEFYFDKTEYDYTIDAFSGNIVEYDIDYD